jgi:hypothetical protein
MMITDERQLADQLVSIVVVVFFTRRPVRARFGIR